MRSDEELLLGKAVLFDGDHRVAGLRNPGIHEGDDIFPTGSAQFLPQVVTFSVLVGIFCKVTF